MEFKNPESVGFTVYSKSGCKNCTNVKELIKENNLLYEEINCDEYLLENKEDFLNFIEKNAGKSYKTFPIVFYDNKFVGGLSHTIEFIDKLLVSFEDNF